MYKCTSGLTWRKSAKRLILFCTFVYIFFYFKTYKKVFYIKDTYFINDIEIKVTKNDIEKVGKHERTDRLEAAYAF